MEFSAHEFESGFEAVQYAEAGGGVAILWEGKHLVARQADVDRIAADGDEFAYLVAADMPDEDDFRIVTIPVND
jgi:hypothetical protein